MNHTYRLEITQSGLYCKISNTPTSSPDHWHWPEQRTQQQRAKGIMDNNIDQRTRSLGHLLTRRAVGKAFLCLSGIVLYLFWVVVQGIGSPSNSIPTFSACCSVSNCVKYVQEPDLVNGVDVDTSWVPPDSI